MEDVPGGHARRVPGLRSVGEGEPRTRHRIVHGYRRAYRLAGQGPVLVLIHGIGDSSATWAELIPDLARTHTVLAPDLLGHGASDKPRADYSVAAYANGIRDLLTTLGIESATLVGHSLGGGVAMQFAYQFPERTERLILVSAGGVGREVNPVLRAASLPGAHLMLSALRLPGMRLNLGLFAHLMRLLDTDLGQDTAELLTLVDALPNATSRSAFIRTLRAVVDWRGQAVTMLDRCYLTEGMPTLLIWGDRTVWCPCGTPTGRTRRCPAADWRSSRARATSRSTPIPHASLPWSRSSPAAHLPRSGAATTGGRCCGPVVPVRPGTGCRTGAYARRANAAPRDDHLA